ncbi:MAG: hypothetical protein EOO17_04495 [Chloroflexi bacterium]|nr:MAG: hypothetical protein EOO17_04495 [Chloroflexota bacterium]
MGELIAFPERHESYEGSRGDMEALSAEWLSGRMTAEGFDADDIAACTAAILGTTPIVDCDGVMADQYVNQITYPSKRAQTIAQIVASADMGDLYQSYGPLLGRDIYKEELGSDDDNPQLDSAFMQSQHRQLQLLQNYRYPTAIAETVFGKDRQRIVGYQREISRMIADGQITTWQQLTDTDIAFSELFDIGT